MTCATGSPSSRRAWIEISWWLHSAPPCWSPSSRRAWIEISFATSAPWRTKVALLAEGVDRNELRTAKSSKQSKVALLAEGVDRNIKRLRKAVREPVALLAEGVDRNLVLRPVYLLRLASPSSRRAWIEICHWNRNWLAFLVALLAEGVDRNYFMNKTTRCMPGRPPRGGRG